MAGMMPSGMRDLLTQKYAISQQQANAQTTEARANAIRNLEAAKTLVPLANSSIALDKANIGQVNANTDLTKVNTEWAPKRYEADIRGQNAQSDYIEEQAKYYGPRALSDIGLNNANAGYIGKQTSRYDDVVNSEIGLRSAQGRNADASALNNLGAAGVQARGMMPTIEGGKFANSAASSIFQGIMEQPKSTAFTPIAPPAIGSVSSGADLGTITPTTVYAPADAPVSRRTSLLPSITDLPSFTRPTTFLNPFGGKPLGTFKRGVTSVPGKGTGDKMPAVLEPKEAVLNKHAADMLGRKKIAQLNKAGNEKRAQQDEQRTSKLAKALKQIGMI